MKFFLGAFADFMNGNQTSVLRFQECLIISLLWSCAWNEQWDWKKLMWNNR